MTIPSEFKVNQLESERASSLALQAVKKAEEGDFLSAITSIEEAIRLDSITALNCFHSLRAGFCASIGQEGKPVAAGRSGENEVRMIQRHNYGQQCWWCGNPADSQEHRYKKADIIHLFGKGPYKGDQALSRFTEGMERVVQGPNSKELMFKSNLCQRCNNERSQPFDRAYDQLIGYVDANAASIIASEQIQFSTFCGANWQVGRENVIRYYVKHICCRLAEAAVLVDPRVIDYLDGKGPLCCIEMGFEIREDIVAMEAKLTAEQPSEGSVWIGDGMADHNQSTNTFSRFYSHVGYRWLRVNYQYDESFTSQFNVKPQDVLFLGRGHSVDPATFQ